MVFKNIVFPVDFSDRCSAAAKYVRDMAATFASKVTLVHAVDDPLGWYGSPDPIRAVEIDLPRILEESKQSLQRFAEAEFPGADVSKVSELGDPTELIERTSTDLKADLIMMPTLGGGRFRAALLASVTANVLHDLPIPVWTEVHQDSTLLEHHLPIRNVVCAIDLEPESAGVLRFASDFASHCGAALHIAHGIPVTELLLGKYIEVKPPAYMEDFARAEIEKLQREAGTSADLWLEGAPIAEVVRNAAIHHHADLIVLGRGGIGHFAGQLKSHTYSIILKSPCPVLSL
ncbi:MAG TPA: universal stress protein [Bryobacteraceae bacterium]|nr:universal stress protein [Bryobacteraceae bacterium]